MTVFWTLFEGGGVGIDVVDVDVVLAVVSGSKSLMRSSKDSDVEETPEMFVETHIRFCFNHNLPSMKDVRTEMPDFGG